MSDERIEEDHAQPLDPDQLQDFELFKSNLLSMRPWWQKYFDWLDDHLIATVAIGFFGSILLLIPTIFIIVTAIFCINSENQIKNIISNMQISWEDRHSPPKPGVTPFINTNFAVMPSFRFSWLKPLWLKDEIKERENALCKYYEIEVEEKKPTHIKLAEQQVKIIQNSLKQLGQHWVIENALKIEEENNQAYIVHTSSILHEKTFNRLCVFMKTVFDLSPNITIEPVKASYNIYNKTYERHDYKAQFPVKENINLNKTALNLFSKANLAFSEVSNLINTIKGGEEIDILKENFISSLNLAVGENDEVILKSSFLDKTAYETYPVKDFPKIQAEREKWFKNLKEILTNKIGEDNFVLTYHVEDKVSPNSGSSEEHQTNHPFSFNLIIKPDSFDSLLNVQNTSENNINNRISNI